MPLNEHAYAYKALYQHATTQKEPLKVSLGKTLKEPEPDIYKKMLRLSKCIDVIEEQQAPWGVFQRDKLEVSLETLKRLKKQVLDLHRSLQHRGVLSKDQSCAGCNDVDFLVYQNAVTFENLEETAQALNDIDMEPILSVSNNK